MTSAPRRVSNDAGRRVKTAFWKDGGGQCHELQLKSHNSMAYTILLCLEIGVGLAVFDVAIECRNR